MLNRIFKSVIKGLFLAAITLFLSACAKDKETIALIIVKDSSGQIVSNAGVTLSPDPTISSGGLYPESSLTKSKTTDSNGRASFTYELEAILNVEVSKLIGNTTYTGSNIIRLQRGKTIKKVININ